MGNNKGRKKRVRKRARTSQRRAARKARKEAEAKGKVFWDKFFEKEKKRQSFFQVELPGEVLHWIYEEAWRLAPNKEIDKMEARFPGKDWVREARRNNYFPPGWAGKVYRSATMAGTIGHCAACVGTIIRCSMPSPRAKEIVQDLLAGITPDLGPGVQWARSLEKGHQEAIYEIGLEVLHSALEDLATLQRNLDYEDEDWKFDLIHFCLDMDDFASMHNVLSHTSKWDPDEEDFSKKLREASEFVIREVRSFLLSLEKPIDGIYGENERLMRAAWCCPLSFWTDPVVKDGVLMLA